MNTVVKNYQGNQGLKEITLNSLAAIGQLYIMETSYASLNTIFSYQEAEDFRVQLLTRDIKCFQITNELFYEYTSLSEFHRKVMRVRHISREKLSIDREILIYNDTVAFYQIEGDDIYGVEIIDTAFARQQRQIFEMIWKQSERPPSSANARTSIF